MSSSTPPITPDHASVSINATPGAVQTSDLPTNSHYKAAAIPKPKTVSPLLQPATHAAQSTTHAAPPDASLLPSFKQLAHDMTVWKPGDHWPLSDISMSFKLDDIARLCKWILQIDLAPKEPELVAHIKATFELLLTHLITRYTDKSRRKLGFCDPKLQARALVLTTIQQVLESPQAIRAYPCVIRHLTNFEAVDQFLISPTLQRLMIQTELPLPPDLPEAMAAHAYYYFTNSEIQGPLYGLEYLAQRTGKSPQEALELLPSHFWTDHFKLTEYGHFNDPMINFIDQLSRYIEIPIAFLASCAPKSQNSLLRTRLQGIVSEMFVRDDDPDNQVFQVIYQSGAARIASALFRAAPDDNAANIIATTFIDLFQRDPSICREYSACFALILEKTHSPALLERAIACITPDLACSDPTLRETIFRMARSRAVFQQEILVSAALGPAHITTQKPSETWALWRTSLIKSTPQHKLIIERELSNVGEHTFLAVAEVFTRAIELAHTIGFNVLPNKEGILAPDTVAFVAAVMSPRKGNFSDFALQLNQAHIHIKPDPYASSFSHYLADRVVTPTSMAHQPLKAAPDPRVCALALSEGRTTLNKPATKGNQGYNLLTFGAAAICFERHCHGIAKEITKIRTHNQFHPILSARGKVPVTLWADPDPHTGITIQEIDTDDFRLREAKLLGHCGGATPHDRERTHCAQYAVRKNDLSIATFDVSLERHQTNIIDEHILRGAGRSCEILFGDRILRVKDIGGPGDTKLIPAEVTAAWERFALFLQENATIPENRLADRPPWLAPLSSDPVISKCGYDYKNPKECQRVFALVCQHPKMLSPELKLFRYMFTKDQTAEQWVLGDQ